MLNPEDRKRWAEAAGKATRLKSAPEYSITTNGQVFSLRNWRGYGVRPLAQSPNTGGYPSVRLMLAGKRRRRTVHSLLAEAFLGPKPSPKHEIRHLDGVRARSVLENICWGTVAENAADRKAHGNEKAAENGRKSAWKLRGRKRPLRADIARELGE